MARISDSEMHWLLKDVVGGDDDAVGEEGLLDGGIVDGPGASPEAEGNCADARFNRHFVPFNVISLAFSCTTHA